MLNKTFFEKPTTVPEYSVSAFWFWNDQIEDKTTSEQLQLMKEIHANQPIIHARSGLLNEYLSQDWFDRIGNVIEECKKSGQKIWLYDEENWPSGNCAMTITKEEEYREHFLQFEQCIVQAGSVYELELSRKEYINVTAYRENGEAIDLLQFQTNNYIHYIPVEKVEIYAVCVEVDEYEPYGKLNVDYLSKKAIGKFIETTHERYREQFGEQFGDVIQGIFMDETRFCNANPWTKELPDYFYAKKSYAIIPYLPLLRRDCEEAAKVRYDYYDVISDMYIEATFKQVYDWCEKYHLQTIGHFLGEETIATQSYFGGDMMRGYQYFHVPGIDHLGNGIGSLDAKFATSACHHYGKTRIACEAFGAAGWEMPYEDMVRISNWLFQQGINLIIMHAFYYSIRDERKDDFPPSYFYQWEHWDKMPGYVAMANRMMYMLSEGRHEAELLVYTPIETFWKYFKPDLNVKTGFWEEGPWIANDRAAMIDQEFQYLCNTLTDQNLDYDILHADAADNFVVEGKQLVNLRSGERYSVIVLPFVEILPERMAKVIETFGHAGGTILSYQSEIKIPNSTDNIVEAKDLAHIISLCRKHIVLPFEIRKGINHMRHTKMAYPKRLIDPYIHDGERVYGIGVSRYLRDGKRILNITNYEEKEEKIHIYVESEEVPELWIPETGEIRLADCIISAEKGYECVITIPSNRTYFLVCKLEKD